MYDHNNRKWYLFEHFENGKPVCYRDYYKVNKSFKNLGKPPSIKLIVSNISLIIITILFMIVPTLLMTVIFYLDGSLTFVFTLSNVAYLLMTSIVVMLLVYCVIYWTIEVRYMFLFRKEYGDNKNK